jgi:hypothetical protein
MIFTDFNGDRQTDLAVLRDNSQKLSILLGKEQSYTYAWKPIFDSNLKDKNLVTFFFL